MPRHRPTLKRFLGSHALLNVEFRSIVFLILAAVVVSTHAATSLVDGVCPSSIDRHCTLVIEFIANRIHLMQVRLCGRHGRSSIETAGPHVGRRSVATDSAVLIAIVADGNRLLLHTGDSHLLHGQLLRD